jgi:hypothetical protein
MINRTSPALRWTLACVVSAAPLFGDFSYEQTSQMTGGAMLGMMKFAGAFAPKGQKPAEPILTTVSLKENRMVRKSAQEAFVIDLDKQTITRIHFAKKTYSSMTFAQMKEQMEKMSERMKSNADAQKTNASVSVKVNDTGQSKAVSGNETHEMILTMTMASTDPSTGNSGEMNVSSDMWIAPGVPGYEEVRDFHKRMADAMGWVPGDNPMLNRPDLAKAMAEVYQQGSKLNGLPLETVIKMGIAGQPAPDSAGQAQPAAAASQPQQQQQTSQPNSPGSALSSALGSRFGLGRHKKQDNGNADSSASSSGGASSGSLIEMTTQVTSFNSNPVDPSIFDVPAGFKQVEEEAIPNQRHHS